jgi:hypothetical protein
MVNKKRKAFFPVVLLFILVNAFLLSGKNILARWGADQEVMIIGNIVLFGITIVSFLLAKRGLKSNNTHVFLRGVYSGIMIKLFLCIIAAFVYISIYKSGINKPALFTLMGLYLVYTFIEVSSLMKLLRTKENG